MTQHQKRLAKMQAEENQRAAANHRQPRQILLPSGGRDDNDGQCGCGSYEDHAPGTETAGRGSGWAAARRTVEKQRTQK